MQDTHCATHPRRREAQPLNAGTRVARNATIVVVLLVALWEGYRAAALALGNTWPGSSVNLPIRVTGSGNAQTFPHLWEILTALGRPYRGGGELLAALQQAGLDPDDDVELVDQPFDMSLLLNREIDSAQAITYNEYAQLLETENPETGELYQPEDFVTLDMNDAGVAMLHDSVFASQAFVEDNEDLTVRFLRASFRGWMHCRDNPEECVEITFNRGSILGQGHQRWMMNEVNALIWPSTGGIGYLDPAAFDQTAELATTYVDVIDEQPGDEAFTNDYVEQAWEGLEGDPFGEDWEREDVEVTPGGE